MDQMQTEQLTAAAPVFLPVHSPKVLTKIYKSRSHTGGIALVSMPSPVQKLITSAQLTLHVWTRLLIVIACKR